MEEGGYVVLTQEEEEEEGSFDAAEAQREYEARVAAEPYDDTIVEWLKTMLPRLNGLSKRDRDQFSGEKRFMDTLGIDDGLVDPNLYRGPKPIYDALPNIMIFFSLSEANRHVITTCSDFCRLPYVIAPSRKHGLGLFAQDTFVFDDPVCEYGGLRLYGQGAGSLPASHRYVVTVTTTSPCDSKVDSQDNTVEFILDGEYGFTLGQAGRWANSSKKHANCELRYCPTGEYGDRVMLVATRTIKDGEEILWDYGERYWGSKTNKKQRLVETKLASFYI